MVNQPLHSPALQMYEYCRSKTSKIKDCLFIHAHPFIYQLTNTGRILEFLECNECLRCICISICISICIWPDWPCHSLRWNVPSIPPTEPEPDRPRPRQAEVEIEGSPCTRDRGSDLLFFISSFVSCFGKVCAGVHTWFVRSPYRAEEMLA